MCYFTFYKKHFDELVYYLHYLVLNENHFVDVIYIIPINYYTLTTFKSLALEKNISTFTLHNFHNTYIYRL